MDKKLGVGALKGAGVLYQDDLYDLARVLLKMYDAREASTGAKVRPTLNGLAKKYSVLMDIGLDAILRTIENHGLTLDTVLDHDDGDAT